MLYIAFLVLHFILTDCNQSNTTTTDSVIQHEQNVMSGMKKGIERFIVCDSRNNDEYCHNNGVCFESTIHKGMYICK